MEYVNGFMFDQSQKRIALIRKEKPVWQKGKLNGIGGKIEPGESPLEAMVREFAEETGLITLPEDWFQFAVLRGESFVVHFFLTHCGKIGELRTTTEEEVIVKYLESVDIDECIPNLAWLIPMAMKVNFDAIWFEINCKYD